MKVGTILGVWIFSSLPAFAQSRVERLTPEHRKWLEQDVAYIITDVEREAFLSIDAAEVRDRFIEAFWRRRDPNPATLENELKEEHQRRLRYATEVLGRETARPGWRTDRGRFYILLGEPKEIQRYDREELQPVELWFYETDPDQGLPPFFHLLFFRPRTTGEFELYHPTFHGPRALVVDSQARALSNQMALEMLRDVSVELARAALSYDPSEKAYTAGAISSAGTDLLLARIEDFPKRMARTDYVDAWKRYGRRVSAEYSFNFVRSRATFAVFSGPEDTAFLHYGIEIDPQNFNLEATEDGSRFYTVVELDLEIRGVDGSLIVSREREIPVQMNRSQFELAKASPVALQGAFPVVPGRYQVSIVARNRVLSQYTVAETEIEVGAVSSGEPALTDLVLGFRSELVPEGIEGEVRPFQLGPGLVHPAADGVFALGEMVHALSQVHVTGPGYRVRFRLARPEETIQEWERELELGRGDPLVESFSLDRIEMAGHYELQMALVDPEGRLVAERSRPLLVSPRTAVTRAGYLAREGFNGAMPGLLSLEKGEQLLRVGRKDEALAELERAVAAENPDLPEARWKLAALLINAGDADRILELLTPLEKRFPSQFEVVAGLGFAYYQRQEFEKGKVYLERAMQVRAPYPSLLNSLADCYERTGQRERALELFRQSLELDPAQPVVRERIESLRSGASPERDAGCRTMVQHPAL